MKKSFRFSIFITALLLTGTCLPAQTPHWLLAPDGGIYRSCDSTSKLPYADNIEMAGRKVAGIIDYQIDTAGMLQVNRKIIFPQLHPYIKSTDADWKIYRAYLTEEYADDILPRLFHEERELILPQIEKIEINGMLHFSHFPLPNGLKIDRQLFPSMEDRLFVERWVLKNQSRQTLLLKAIPYHQNGGSIGAKGRFLTSVHSVIAKDIKISPGGTYVFNINMSAQLNEEEPIENPAAQALKGRQQYLATISDALQLETPIESLNTLFRFSKIRAAESIFDSELGLIHSPGGGRYYVGIWANDQAEYINPFLPYLGYNKGLISAMNTYRAFAGELNPDYQKIRYAFEIEGLVPPFLLDRGDAAMIAYGATHFALANGDQKAAKTLWPLIEWCLEYCHRQLNEEGLVRSESDEMEGRIETGTANLSTSSLYYGALHHAADLASALNQKQEVIDRYQKQAQTLEKAIENYFGAEVEGLNTYKYYKEHQKLRHWICLPLVVGIHTRSEATITALFDRLWTANGVMVEKNSDNPRIANIFWDRGTLYALRAALIAGEQSQSIERLIEFSEKRLLGDRVPYVVEAYPEGSMAHLSAESALYCRVFTEGLFGIYPLGFDRFRLCPRLPDGWDQMALRQIKAFGRSFDIEIVRAGEKWQVKVLDSVKAEKILEKMIEPGDLLEVVLE